MPGKSKHTDKKSKRREEKRVQRCEAFQIWVKAQGGKEVVARLIGVEPGTVHWWFYRQGRPNTENLLALVRIADGDLTVDEIIESTRPFGAPSDSTARKRVARAAAKRKH